MKNNTMKNEDFKREPAHRELEHQTARAQALLDGALASLDEAMAALAEGAAMAKEAGESEAVSDIQAKQNELIYLLHCAGHCHKLWPDRDGD